MVSKFQFRRIYILKTFFNINYISSEAMIFAVMNAIFTIA